MEINKSTVANALMWKTLEGIFSQGASLAVQIVLARILTPSDFGELAIILAIINYVVIFVQSGLSSALIQKKNMDQLDVSTVLTSSLVVALLMYILLFLLSPVFVSLYKMPNLLWPLRVLSASLFFNAIYSVELAIFSRNMKFRQMLIRSLVSIPLSGMIGIVMAYNGFGVWALVAQNLSNLFLTVILMSFGLNYKLCFGFSRERAKQVYSFGGKILLTNILNGFRDSLRTMIIGKKYTVEDLAFYSKAYTYASYTNQIITSSISSVLLPSFSRKQDDLVYLHDVARKSVRLSTFVMFPVLLGAFAIARPLFLLLLTEKWEKCISFFMIFCLLRMPDAVKSIDVQIYYSLGKSGLHLMYSIFFCILNIIMIFLTMPISIHAIAVGSVIVEVLSTVAVAIISFKVYGYTLRERISDIWKPLLCSSVMAIIVYHIQLIELDLLPMLGVQVALGIAVYILFSIIVKDHSLQEVFSIIKMMLKRNKKIV